MKKIMRYGFLVIFILFIYKINSEGSRLFISENKNVDTSAVAYYKYSEKDLNSFYSNKELGSTIKNGTTYFKLFAPNPIKVELVIFNNVEDSDGIAYSMQRDLQGVWEYEINNDLSGKYYAYLVYHKNHIENNTKPNFAVDPYSKAVASYTDYMNPRKSIVFNKDYDWEDDEWIKRDWRDLIIYEMHIRDMTVHPSANADKPGTYHGLIEKNKNGGISYIKSLGVNTVELLPAQEFGYIEIPFKDSLNGRYNTWNPYERNHWGYMTSNFFAPAAYYSEDMKVLKRNIWIGKEGMQVSHFKDMVKAFHKEGIAVIMDVVYNHLSEYEIGNLKEIDQEYYFRLDGDGNFIAQSYCGNDIKTERPMVRKLIIDSILYWMKEYHIDGFRFDLGKLIDWQTIEAVIREARKINPQVVFICEPWGGGYDPKGFSLREWGSWNDQIRNGIKGENPYNDLGWIFGNWQGNNNQSRIQSYVRGTLIKDELGLFQESKHSVNYLESHDGYTLGDFIRIGLGKVKGEDIIKNIDANIALDSTELKLHKLAALFLFTSQGITMIHAGQEYARSKVIAFEEGIEDEHAGMLDHNSYNKDNETNYLNFNQTKINNELLNYYKGLIKLRKSHDAFRKANYSNYNFLPIKGKEFAIVYELTHKNKIYFVAFNAHPKSKLKVDLPTGWWEVLADENGVLSEKKKAINGSALLNPSTGLVLELKL